MKKKSVATATSASSKAAPSKPVPKSGSGRRQRRSTETVRSLILQAARALFSERGYAGATTREIALRADTNEVLLFRHFTSKAQLFEQAVFEPFKGFIEEFSERHSLQGSPAPMDADAHDFVEGLYRVFFENRRLMMALIAASMYEPDVKSSMADIDAMHDYFKAAENYVRREGIDSAIGIGTGVRLSFGLVAAAVLFEDWMFAGTRPARSPRRMIDDLSAFIVGGFSGTRDSLPAENSKSPAAAARKTARTGSRRKSSV
jgi:AcrR family transcriptional regulator